MKKEKHNHKLTNLLKVCIFGVIMIAPFFAVLSKTLYITFNKNAQDSYAGYNEYEMSLNLLNYKNKNSLSIEEYTIDNTKTLYVDYSTLENSLFTNSQKIYGDNRNLGYGLNVKEIRITNNNGTKTYTNAFITFSTDRNQQINGNIHIYENIIYQKTNSYLLKEYDSYIRFYKNSTRQAATKIISASTNITNIKIIMYDAYIYFSYYANNTTYINTSLQEWITNITYTTGTLDNVFYSAVNQLNNEPIFNWAKDTGIYNALNNFTTGLTGTTNSTLALLLAYWFIITAIYIVIDIIIFAFTYLTHFFNN